MWHNAGSFDVSEVKFGFPKIALLRFFFNFNYVPMAELFLSEIKKELQL